MKVRLLALDVDGTLLNPAGDLTPRVAAAVRAAAAAGCIVTLATGRRFRTARPIAELLGLDLPILVQNGALIKDALSGKVLYHRHLDSAAARAVVAALWEAGAQPIVYENAFQGDAVFIGPEGRDNRINGRYFARFPEFGRCASLEELLPVHPPLEIATVDDAERVRALALLVAAPAVRVIATTYTSSNGFLEALDAQCSKGAALRAMAERCDVPMAATMAIGDNLNDLELLGAAGVSVAMGNARPEVQALARYVTAANDQDGVAEAIARFVLERPLEEA